MLESGHIGRRYTSESHLVDGDAASRFGALLGLGEETEPGTIPPTFAAVYCLFPALHCLFTDPELSLSVDGLVHVDQSFEWPEAARSGDVVETSAEITRVEKRRGLTLLDVLATARRADGTVLCCSRSTLLMRAIP